MSAIAKTADARVARPLKVLVPLIKDDIERGQEAASRASMPYYQAAGEKLLEAKAQLAHGEFGPWIKRHFNKSLQQARTWMSLAEHAEKESVLSFSSLSDFKRKTSNPNYNLPHTVRPAEWHEDVKKIESRVDTDTLNLKREELKQTDEREAQRQLATQLIDIGYKVLARKLHPDRGGSREAMARLNDVRNRLKNCI